MGVSVQAEENILAQAEQKAEEKINDYLTETGVFFLATALDKQPHLRPLGMHFIMDGKLWFGVGDQKEVYKQLKKNPLVEIVALKKDNHWLRYSGKVVFAMDQKYAQKALEMSPYLKEIYNSKTGHKLMMFYVEDATALDMSIDGKSQVIL
jgi:uncharacterized pyridoxamine 5'-phosphate oxidase family protein